MFAHKYIEKNVVYPRFIEAGLNPESYLIVMIPCLNEPAIIRTLESLWSCRRPLSPCEVVVVVNESEMAPDAIKATNEKTYQDLLAWKKVNDAEGLVLHPIYARAVDARSAGAGMARKIGMDEIIRRFNDINRPEGVIVSLDADCLVSENYLDEIEQTFRTDKKCFAATLNFKHRAEEMTDKWQRTGIELYEEYLHYYKQAIGYAGFPNSIYTIGSAFAVRADAYVKQGGMNRRQAGEDFYFLNKLTNLGRLTEIDQVYVFPSARVSDRVPFGTGAALNKWMNREGDLTVTYNFQAFLDLKMLFDRVELFYRVDEATYQSLKIAFAQSITDYFKLIDFERKIVEINKYSSSLSAFKKRFFQFFDAFVIMRFLNISHQDYYQRQNLQEAISQLKEVSGQ